MADVTIEASLVASGTSVGWTNAIVWTTPNIGYAFFLSSANALQYRKTTDGGATWGSAVNVDATNTVAQFCVWYGKWSTSNAIIHIWSNDTGDQLRYRSLDPSSDTLGTQVTVASSLATGIPVTNSWANVGLSGCRSLSGNLMVIGKFDNGGSVGDAGVRRSTDQGVNWTSRGSVLETGADEMMLLPGNLADQADMFAIYMDASADELSAKFYDDSGNNWPNETTISGAGGYVEPGTHLNWDAMYYNGTIYVCWFTVHNSSSANLKFASFPANSATPTVTTKTNVLSASNGSVSPRIMINAANGDLYVFYLRGTVSSAMQLYYKKSSDGGANWGTETAYAQAAASNYLICDSGRLAHGTDGGRIGATWRHDTNDDLFFNAANSITVAAAGGAGKPHHYYAQQRAA